MLRPDAVDIDDLVVDMTCDYWDNIPILFEQNSPKIDVWHVTRCNYHVLLSRTSWGQLGAFTGLWNFSIVNYGIFP